MIHEVDKVLRALIERDAVNGGDVEVAFDVPSKEWAAKRSKPTVNVFLFDVREELSRRRIEPQRVYADDGTVTGRKRPPRFFRLSYLITAWTQRAEDEHRLLSAALHAFLPHEQLPEDLLADSLLEAEGPVHLTVGTPPPAERAIGEIWNALGGELKPSLELHVVVPFDISGELPAGPPVTEEPRLAVAGADGQQEDVGGGDVSAPTEDEEVAVAGAEETIRAGGEDDPGRILTIRTVTRP